MKIQTYTVP